MRISFGAARPVERGDGALCFCSKVCLRRGDDLVCDATTSRAGFTAILGSVSPRGLVIPAGLDAENQKTPNRKKLVWL